VEEELIPLTINDYTRYSPHDKNTESDTLSRILNAFYHLHRHLSHLLQSPVPSHILSPQSFNFLIQMLPKYVSPRIHLGFQHTQLKIRLSTPTLLQILLKHIHTLMNLLVLPQQLRCIPPILKFGHLLRENGEDVLLFYRVVGGEMRTELDAGGEELSQGEVGRAFVLFAGVVEESPGLAEVVVLEGH
jgi:hypothetical protein